MRALTLARKVVGLPETSESLRAEIAALQREHADALFSADTLEAERVAAETFDQASELQRRVAESKWKADRAAAKLPELEQRLLDAKARERLTLVAHHLLTRTKLFNKLHAALKSAAEVQTEAIKHDQLACSELGEGLARAKLPAIPFRGLLLEEHVETWARSVSKALLAAEPSLEKPRKVGPAPRHGSELTHGVRLHGGVPIQMVGVAGNRSPGEGRSRPAKQSEPAGTQHAVYLDPGVSPTPGKRVQIIKDDAPLEAGQARVAVLRAGFEWAGRVCRPGDIIRMPLEQARGGALNGALDILEPRDLIVLGGGKT